MTCSVHCSSDGALQLAAGDLLVPVVDAAGRPVGLDVLDELAMARRLRFTDGERWASI
ncbi:hypothetical protein [Saccharopolyspora sp. ASAGF58]|uniref:hypothetical protein n=1 Tax=Saccharopolyspora sp. ASAGF58 TaxID=2719023 RepID=UPI001445940A|nr:hypothetical protein [Saccharopolyspora sp. ASAGF58]